MFFSACLISWLFGIFLSGYLNSNILVFILAAFFAGLWVVVNLLMFVATKQKLPFGKILLKAFILLMFGVISSQVYQGYESHQIKTAIAFCRENPDSVTGVVTSEVNRYNGTDYCTLTLDNNRKISVKIRTNQPLFPGEKITVYEPMLSAVFPENSASGQTRRLMGNDTFLSAGFPYEPTVIRHGVQNWWLYGSKTLRNLSKEHFHDHYPPDTAAFLTALTSSDKSLMEEDMYQEFISTGTVHIVVVSGMHFSFLANVVLLGLGMFFQSRRTRLFITLPLLGLFAWFTGGTIPVLRSLVMISVLFLYDIFYLKPVKSYVTVLIIACVFVTVTPTLIFNPSFLLTFGATFGITAFYEPLVGLFRKIPSNYLKSTLAMYLAVQPFTLPVILLYFSRMPVGAILANFLVAPLVAPILILAVIGMAVMHIPMLGQLILWIGNLTAEFFLYLVHISAALSRPLAIPLKELPFLLWIGSGVLVFFCKTKHQIKRLFLGTLAAIFMITAFVNTAFPGLENQLTITFLGAKNTNSAVIETPANRLILYGTLQDIAYGKGSSYEETAPVALIILTDLADSEMAEALLNDFPDASLVCPARYENLLENKENTVLLTENLTTETDGIHIRLFADHTTLYEAEFTYGEHLFSFSQNADYVLRNSHINPEKIWIVNFKRSGNATARIAQIPPNFRSISKKDWHPDTKQYDNYSMLIFRQKEIVFYGTKEQNLLWN